MLSFLLISPVDIAWRTTLGSDPREEAASPLQRSPGPVLKPFLLGAGAPRSRFQIHAIYTIISLSIIAMSAHMSTLSMFDL